MPIRWIYVTMFAAVPDNANNNEAVLVTDDNLLYYLPPTAEKDEDSASESMNEDVRTGGSDKHQHRGGLRLFQRQFSIYNKSPVVTFVRCLVIHLLV